MKKCLRCGQSYSDDTLNFCLNDGELLVEGSRYEPPPTQYADDSPPTILMNQPRVTNPIGDWPQSPVRWQDQSPAQVPLQQYAMANQGVGRNTTLPTISLILSIISCFLICCGVGGILFGLPAAIVGFIALKNIESNPALYGGRGLAIAGMVIGIITFIGSVAFMLFSVLTS